MERYNFKIIESKWQEYWEENKSFKSSVSKEKKFYCLEMFPYPSGKIHMGHVRNYAIGDVLARYKIMKVTMYFIRWVGIHLECQQKTQQDKII